MSEPDAGHSESFFMELEVRGSTVVEAKRNATVWPRVFDQITDDAIGLSSGGDQFHVFIDPECFENFSVLASGGVPIVISLYARKLAPSGYVVTMMHVSSVIEARI